MRVAALAVLLTTGLARGLAAGQAPSQAQPDTWPRTDEKLWRQGAFDPANLAKPRPPAPFDLTGVWIQKPERTNGFNLGFQPMPKLKPKAQTLFDAGVRANAEGKAFHDDTGACWPGGMPKWWNRVQPVQFMQYPTVIVGIHGLFNWPRWIYLDGRGHVNPDLGEPTYNGDSVGRWEGDTLVIDTTNLQTERHWMMQGVPVSDKLHIVERIRMAPDHQTFTVDLVMTDPDNWEGEWRSSRTYRSVLNQDIVENHCIPELNDQIIGAKPAHNVR
jgi:hypothetical protein